MKIGVIGSGRVGGALAASWREKGHHVIVSTRETVVATAESADVVVLATPASAVVAVLEQVCDAIDGKVLVDATNNLSGGPAGLEIAALAPASRYVKAFNTVFSTYMHDTPPEPRASLVLCGDDAGAKETVAALVADLGFEPVDAGGLESTPLVEAFAHLVIGIAYRQGRGPFVYRFGTS